MPRNLLLLHGIVFAPLGQYFSQFEYMKKFFFLLPLAVLSACGGDNAESGADKDVLMTSDIDGAAGWVADPNALVKGEAHSGQYSLRVDQTHTFSPGYTAIMGKLSPTHLRGVKLEAWVYATDKNAKGKLELVVNEGPGGKELLHDQTKLDEAGAVGKWVKVSKDIIFPATVAYSSLLTIYVSRAEATSPAYVDDLKLTALR